MTHKLLFLTATFLFASCSGSELEYPQSYKSGGLNYSEMEFFRVEVNGFSSLEGIDFDAGNAAIVSDINSMGVPFQEIRLLSESKVLFVSNMGEVVEAEYQLSDNVLIATDNVTEEKAYFTLRSDENELYMCIIIYLTPKYGPTLDVCPSLRTTVEHTVDSLITHRNLIPGDSLGVSLSEYYFVKE